MYGNLIPVLIRATKKEGKRFCINTFALTGLLILAGTQIGHAKYHHGLNISGRIDGENNSLVHSSATRKMENCPALFSSFEDLEVEPLYFDTGDFPPGVLMVKDTVDLDRDGDQERVLLDHEGTEYDVTKGPQSNLVIIGTKNPAFSNPSKENVSVLFKPKNIQSAQKLLDYRYLSFDNFLSRMSIKGANKGTKESPGRWSDLEYQEFFRLRNFPDELTKGKPVSLEPTLVRVGTVTGKPYLLLNAKPIDFAEDGNTLRGYDGNGRYVGRRFEFLALYEGGKMLDLLCARVVGPKSETSK